MPSTTGSISYVDIVLTEGGNLYVAISGQKWRYCLKADDQNYPHVLPLLLAAKLAKEQRTTLEGERMVETAAKDTYYLDRVRFN